MNNIKVISLGGLALSGKNTFTEISKNILERNGYNIYEIAFADFLKEEVADMFKDNGFPIDIYDLSAEEKKKHRDLLVWWGRARRDMSEKGLYWVNYVDNYIQDIVRAHNYEKNKLVFLISDVRYKNECDFVHNTWKGVVIHLKQWKYVDYRDGSGEIIQFKKFNSPPNKEEEENDPLVQHEADYHVEWEYKNKSTIKDAAIDSELQKIVIDTLNSTKYFIDSKLI